MAVNLNTNYSFHETPSGDIAIKQGQHQTDVRIKALDPSSPETKEKIQKGSAVLLQLSTSEQVPVETKELKKAIKHLTSNNAAVQKTLTSLPRSPDVPGLLSGAKALSIDWNEHLNEIKDLSHAQTVHAALEMDDNLQKGIDGLIKNNSAPAEVKKLTGYRAKAQRLIEKNIRELELESVQSHDPAHAIETMNLAREVQSYKNQLEQTQQKIPFWLAKAAHNLAKITSVTRSQLPTHTSKAAAQKGDALRRATDQMVSQLKQNARLEPLGTSAQEVFLGPDVVFKRTTSTRAAEEERLADGVGAIFDPDTYVPQIGLKIMTPARLDIPILSPENQSRSLPMETYRYTTEPHYFILSSLMTAGAFYKLFATDSTEEYISDMKRVYNNDQPDLKLGQIYLDLETGYSSQKSDELKAVYARCEQRTWEAKDPVSQKWVKLHSPLELVIAIQGKLEVRPQDMAKLDFMSSNQVQEDMDTLSNLTHCVRYSPATLQWTEEARPGSQVSAKPRVAHMQTLGQLEDKYILDDVLAKVKDPSQQVKSVRTLYMQPLDLHADNIGVHPTQTPELKKYEEARFSYGQRKNEDVYQAQLDFIAEDINPNTQITLTHSDGTQEKGLIADFPDLVTALSGDWELDYFDTDINMAESNDLLKNEQYGTVAPLRNALITTPLAEVPLSPEAIAKIRQDTFKLPEVMHYLKNDHHPIFQRLSAELRAGLRELLDEELDHYALGNDFIKDRSNLDQLKYEFASNLAKDPDSAIWQYVDYAMNSPPNPSITSHDMESKRYKLAAELFPKATIAQQEALEQRIERQDQYLSAYETLQDLEIDQISPEDAIDTLGNYVQQIEIPLSTYERELFLETLNKISALPDAQFQRAQLIDFKTLLLDKTKPSLAAIVKAQTPIVSDLLELSAQVWGQKSLPDWQETVDDLLRDARKSGINEQNSLSYARVKLAFDQVQ